MEQANITPNVKPPRWKSSFKLSGNMALITGITMGLLAAVVQGYFGLQPPAGDGICGISHPANVVNWLVNNITKLFGSGTNYTIHSIFVTVPDSLMGRLASNSAAKAWWATAGTVAMNRPKPATTTASVFRIGCLSSIIVSTLAQYYR